jgi:hypothetical protein
LSKNENMKFADLLDEFNWVLNVLNSVNSRKQLLSARNLYNCWRNKYQELNKFELYTKFEQEFINKEESLWGIDFSKNI